MHPSFPGVDSRETQPATFAGRGCFPALSFIFLCCKKLFVTSSFSNLLQMGKKKATKPYHPFLDACLRG
jgi:hypothetical protein